MHAPGASGTRSLSTPTPSLPPLPIFTALLSHPPSSPAIVDPTSTPHTYSTLLTALSLGHLRLLDFYGAPASPADPQTQPPSLHGARIAFLAPNSFQWVATLLSIWAAGGIAVPLCATHPPREIAYVLGDSGAAVVLASRESLCKVEAAVEILRQENQVSLNQETRVGGIEGLFTPASPGVAEPRILAPQGGVNAWLNKPALIIYTSGTTSLPKGVVSTHLNLSAQSASLLSAWGYSPKDYLLHLLPLHHVHGILNCTLVPLLAGAAVEFTQLPFNPVHILTRLAQGARGEREKVTLLMAVPAIYTRLLGKYNSDEIDDAIRGDIQKAVRGLRLAVCGSAGLPWSVGREWLSISGGERLLERYGMTEVGMAVSCVPGKGEVGKPEGSVGWVLPGYEVGLRKVEGEGEDSPAASSSSSPSPDSTTTSSESTAPPESAPQHTIEGEVLIRGPGVFTTYWNRPPETTQTEFLPQEYTPQIILSPNLPGSPFPPLSTLQIVGQNTNTNIDIPTTPSAYPWFKTGDFARLSPVPTTSPSSTPPSPPPLTLLGRLSTDILKSGGEKLSALEIEREILLLPSPPCPGISEVAVVGLPSRKWGELVAAVVVLRGGKDEEKEKEQGGEWGWDEDRVGQVIKEELKKRVAGWKVPKVIKLVGELPRNVMGKVGKKEVIKSVFGGWREEEN